MSQEREDINQLLQQLAKKKVPAPTLDAQIPRPRPSREQQRSAARTQKVFLCAGGVLVGIGIALLVLALLRPAPVEIEAGAPTDELIGTPEGEALQARSTLQESKLPNRHSLAQVPRPKAHDFRREQEKFLQGLKVNGKLPRFQSPGDLRPALGKGPVSVYCLLFEPLDQATAEVWAESGLLRLETEVPSPFLRFVTIETEKQLALLYDDHVEGICFDPYSPTTEK